MQAPALPDLDTLDPAALKALVLAQHAQLTARDTEIEHLTLLVAKLKRLHFGQKSEKLHRDLDQLELRLEDLEAARASAPLSEPAITLAPEKRQPVRRPLPAHLLRETRTHAPTTDTCPDCGGTLRHLGEDVAEVLDYLPARFRVIRRVRPKLSCACCSKVVQAPAPERPIARGLAGAGLLAHVLVAKYCDHSVPRTGRQRCRPGAVEEMRVGPSKPEIRIRLQTTASCCR